MIGPNLTKTNLFFQQNVYNPLKKLAFSPNAWALAEQGNGVFSMPDLMNLLCWAVLAIPVFIPLTILTSALALTLALIPALIHGVSAFVALGLDTVPDQMNMQPLR